MSTIETQNRDIYDNVWKSKQFSTVSSPGRQWILFLILSLAKRINPADVESLLDVGCGNGFITVSLRQALHDVRIVGVDFSQSGIDAANTQYGDQPNIHFLCANANDTSVLDQSYDVITCFETLEHVEDWKSLVDRFTASARKYILLSFPAGKMMPYEVHDGHIRNFRKGEMETYLATKGFVPVRVLYAGFPFHSPLGKYLLQLFYNAKVENIDSQEKPSPLTRAYHFVTYFLFRYCSTRKRFGGQFVGLFVKPDSQC